MKSVACRIRKTAFDIIVIAGQSNAYGYGRGRSNFHPNENIMMLNYDAEWRADGTIVPDKIHLKKANVWKNKTTSFGLYFANEYVKYDLKEGRKLLILQVAVGGTGFSDHRWGEGETLYETARELIKFTLKSNSQNRIVGFLWHQGETDAMNKVDESYYFEKLKTLIEGFRKAADNETLPFITGDMVNQWKEENPIAIPIEKANRRLEQELENVKFVTTKGLSGNKNPDQIHFSTKANIELGKRYYDALKGMA